jgi:hypothetical protein
MGFDVQPANLHAETRRGNTTVEESAKTVSSAPRNVVYFTPGTLCSTEGW